MDPKDLLCHISVHVSSNSSVGGPRNSVLCANLLSKLKSSYSTASFRGAVTSSFVSHHSVIPLKDGQNWPQAYNRW